MIEKIFIVMLIFGIFCGKINGQIITDRPDQTESSSTVSKGGLQIESGFLIGYEEQDQLSIRQVLLPTNLFRYGITNSIEIRILNQFEMLKIDEKQLDGISDLELGTKIQLIKGGHKNIEAAFLSHLIIPIGTENLTGNKIGTINKISISHEISETLEVGYNLGYNFIEEGNGDFTYSLALGIGINEKVRIYIEPYGEITNMEVFIANFDAGFTYLVNKNLQLDFSFGTGINQSMNYISIGGSWLIEKE